jgi:KipI family sensor histidine kinase inhibitor
VSNRTSRAFGDAALVVPARDPADAAWLSERLRAGAIRGVTDVVGALDSVLVVFDPLAPGADAVGDEVDRVCGEPRGIPSRRRPASIVVPTHFGGEDLPSVAAGIGLDAAAVVDLLTGRDLEVLTLGFSPGFAYLGGLPEPLRGIRRRATPRTAVPAGSVALGGGFAAVYPQATPGGWQLLGTTALRLFDAATPPYATLAPGDRVRFTATAEPTATERADAGRLLLPTGAAPSLFVEDAGALTLAQDAGRRGVAHLGVPGAGPLDPLAHELANRLVGNAAGAAALEVSGTAMTVQALMPLFLAVVGAGAALRVDGRDAPAGHAVPVGPGQLVRVGPPRGGACTYLAVAGGLRVPPVLKSASTDVGSWTGPGRLLAGDTLAVGPRRGPLGDHLSPGAHDAAHEPGDRDPVVLRVLPGPHEEACFEPGAFRTLARRRFVVEGASNRVGLRLSPAGSEPGLSASGDLLSYGTVTGAVQVPPDARPVLLLADHATMGGYPVLAVVITADLHLAARCVPGTAVVLEPVRPDEARRALAELERLRAGAIVGRYPVEAA